MTASAAIALLVGGVPAPAHAEGELQAVADILWDYELASTLLSIPLEIPSPDIAKGCSVRFDIHAEYKKPKSSFNIYERSWGKATPKNCNNESLQVNFLRVEIGDEGSPLFSSLYYTAENGSVQGSTVNYVETSQTVPMFTFPTDQHMVGSRIVFDWMLHLQFQISTAPIRVCAHAEALFPGPIKGGFVACDE